MTRSKSKCILKSYTRNDIAKMSETKKMQAFFWQQLDEEKMSEKKRRERREERSKKLEKRSKIIEYAKVVKFGNWYSIPSAEEKCQEPGKRRLAMSCEKILFFGL